MIVVARCEEALPCLPDDYVDAIVTDPPYGLEFQDESWDAPWRDGDIVTDPSAEGGGQDGAGGNAYSRSRVRYGASSPKLLQAWHEQWLSASLRVIKPGGFLVAMSHPKTYHRLACAAEDVGYEIRGMTEWLYGQGFPKSTNIRRDGKVFGTAQKPGHEPCVVARRPFRGSVQSNMDTHGTGALAISDCRVGDDEIPTHPNPHMRGNAYGRGPKEDPGERGEPTTHIGRWPPDVAISPEAARLLEDQHPGAAQYFPAFRYCSKPNRAERDAGLDERNAHPTIKPIDFMRWIVRLVTPSGGRVLDPFLGSGTTAIACVLERRPWVAIEQNPAYVDDAVKRIRHWQAALERGDFSGRAAPRDQLNLW